MQIPKVHMKLEHDFSASLWQGLYLYSLSLPLSSPELFCCFCFGFFWDYTTVWKDCPQVKKKKNPQMTNLPQKSSNIGQEKT